LHDQNPMWIADSFDCRRAAENGCPQVLPFVVPINLHLRSLNVAPREQLPNWVTGLFWTGVARTSGLDYVGFVWGGLFGFALLQLVAPWNPCHGLGYISKLTG
jgi:hypothetical protein